MPKQYPSIGSVSEGTMRPQDLIPTFLDVLSGIDQDASGDIADRVPDDALEDDEHDWWSGYGDNESGMMLDELFEALDERAPPFCTFGAQDGDGACYGFWPSIESLEQSVRDGEVIKVIDTCCVPADYTGYVMLVNDHGNVTLYETTALHEIWACV